MPFVVAWIFNSFCLSAMTSPRSPLSGFPILFPVPLCSTCFLSNSVSWCQSGFGFLTAKIKGHPFALGANSPLTSTARFGKPPSLINLACLVRVCSLGGLIQGKKTRGCGGARESWFWAGCAGGRRGHNRTLDGINGSERKTEGGRGREWVGGIRESDPRSDAAVHMKANETTLCGWNRANHLLYANRLWEKVSHSVLGLAAPNKHSFCDDWRVPLLTQSLNKALAVLRKTAGYFPPRAGCGAQARSEATDATYGSCCVYIHLCKWGNLSSSVTVLSDTALSPWREAAGYNPFRVFTILALLVPRRIIHQYPPRIHTWFPEGVSRGRGNGSVERRVIAQAVELTTSRY